MAASLRFGDLELPSTEGVVTFEVLGSRSGTNWGKSEGLVREVANFLQDGAASSTDRFGTRDLTVMVRLKAATSADLAAGEELLVAERRKCDPIDGQNTLTWTPPDGGPTSVFIVVRAQLDHDFDDVAESGYVSGSMLYQYWTLTLTALPYARSADLTTITVPAPPASFTEVLIDDCSSTTGWSGSPNAPILDSGTVVEDKVGRGGLSGTVTLIRSGLSASLATTPYVRVTAAGRQSALPNAALSFKLNGNHAAVLASSGNTYWLDGTGLGTLISVEISASVHNGYLYVDSISRTNSTTTGGTGRQNARQIEVGGSARGPGSLSLADPTNALGSALIYTTTDVDAHQPDLRKFLVPGPTITADGTVVSGATSDLSATHNFDLPTQGVKPGGYLLLARVKHASAGARTIGWSAVARMGTTNVDAGQSGSVSVTLAAGVWTVVTVGLLNLPTSVIGPSGFARLNLSGPSGLLLDEAWLFNLDTGRLIWVECGTAAPSAGGSSNRVWLDNASATDPKDAIYRGFAANRSDQVHAGPVAQAWRVPDLTPPAVNVFTVTTNSTAAALSLQHYKHWHTHAAT